MHEVGRQLLCIGQKAAAQVCLGLVVSMYIGPLDFLE